MKRMNIVGNNELIYLCNELYFTLQFAIQRQTYLKVLDCTTTTTILLL